MDLVMERLAADPNLHIYHYAPYEPTAVKRLAGRHQDDCKVRKLVSRGGRRSALGGRRRSWPARAWTSWEKTIPPGAGRSAQC